VRDAEAPCRRAPWHPPAPPPIDYVQALRVEEAKQMLETDDMVLDDIAGAVGYDDSASFRRLFKRRAGLTPAAYRRKFRRVGVGAA
jgi:transcriptional regulator GlxA family with amidase domain